MKQTQPRRRWIFRRLGSGLPSVCVIGLTAFAVGGWWVMMMASRYGRAFCQVWYGGIPETPDSQLLEIVPNSGTLAVWSPLVICLTTMGWLAGLSVYGFWQTCAKSLRARKEAAPRPWRFSVLWAITALAYVSILSSSTQDAVTSHGLLWGFVAIPLTILAAAPIEDMIARRSSRNTVCGLILATALSGIWSLAGNELVRIPWSTTWTSVLLVAVLGSVAGWWIIGFRLKSPASRRYVLRGLILFVLAAHGLTGLAAVRQANDDDGALDSLRRRLVGMGEVDRCTLITLNPRRQRLHYLMQSIWPHAIVDFATNWEAALESSTRPTELRDGPERHLVLTWGEFDRPLTDPANPELKITQATSPQYMGGEPIRAFMVLRRPFHAPSP